MPADAAPQSMSGGNASASTSGHTHSHTGCSPEELYQHVVGRWPGPELGYPGDHSDGHGRGGDLDADASLPVDDADGRGADSAGAAARAKKRRKVQRRAKVSEIWFPRAEMAFCTCVSCIPPNGRTKIKFFGRPLGRNELIAAICTLATRRLYNRKQISSHSQVLKDKVPPAYKEIFTFEDKTRSAEEPGESSTANVIENHVFPDAIYRIIGYRPGTDLANAPKPSWLTALEAGVNESQAPSLDTGSSRSYSYWANSPTDYPSYYDRGPPGYSKDKDREGRPPVSAILPPPAGMDSYYPYSQAPFQSHAPHTLPPLLARDTENSIGPHSAGSDQAGRYGYMGHNLPPMPPGANANSHSRIGGPVWEGGEHSRSPTSTSSVFDAAQSQSSLSPGRAGPGSWSDTKPSITASELVTLPPLQEVPTSQYSDWKDRSGWGAQPPLPSQSASRGGLDAPLPSFGTVASQTGGYAVPPAGWSGSSAYPYWNEDPSRDRRTMSFVPSVLEAGARMSDGTVFALASTEPLVVAPSMPWHSVAMWRLRYPFLEQMAAAPGIPVYHVEIPLSLPSGYAQRSAMFENSVDFDIFLQLRPPATGALTGWAVATDSTLASPAGLPPCNTRVEPLRSCGGGELACTTQLQDLHQLYYQMVRYGGAGDSLADAMPYSVLVQRVIRDTDTRSSSMHPSVDAEWHVAATIFIYSFWVADESAGQRAVTYRLLEFDSAPPADSSDNNQLVADLLAGEEQQRSSFDWLSS